MIKNLILVFSFLIVFGIGSQSVFGQFTISIPKIPKIKKDKAQPKPETPDENQTNQNQPESANKNQPDENRSAGLPGKCSPSGSIWLGAHLDEIGKRQKEVDGFTPDRGWLIQEFTYNHLLNAVSPTARTKWLTDSNALDFKDCPNLVSAFDKLAASAAKKLPLYLPNAKNYAVHSPTEEKLMKGQINELASHKIFYNGLESANWLIDKNDLGIPTARYKHGMVWARYTPDDHPYCHIYYINIIQDYAGGGTYAASYGNFISDELSGCPAGK